MSRGRLGTQGPCRWTKPGQGLGQGGQMSSREGSRPRGQLRGPRGEGEGQLGRSLHPRLPSTGRGPGMPPGQCLAESSSRHSHCPSPGQAVCAFAGPPGSGSPRPGKPRRVHAQPRSRRGSARPGSPAARTRRES